MKIGYINIRSARIDVAWRSVFPGHGREALFSLSFQSSNDIGIGRVIRGLWRGGLDIYFLMKMSKISLIFYLSTGLMSSLVFAHDPYTLLPEYSCNVNLISSVENMPRVRSQGGTRACVGFSAWAIIQHKLCQTKRIPNCALLPPEKELSPISIMSFAHAEKEGGVAERYEDFRNLQLRPYITTETKNMTVAQTLINFRNFATLRVASESCYPFDRIANSFNVTKTLEVDRIFSEMDAVFQKLRKNTEGDVGCVACEEHYKNIKNIEKLNLKFKVAKNITGIKNFEQLLYQLMIGNKCDDQEDSNAISIPQFQVDYYPEKDLEENDTVESFIKVIEEKTKSQKPVAISPFCVERDQKNNCIGYHSSVISSVKTVCTCTAPVSCKKMFKLHNSLGAGWQKATNNGGWVDAEILISNLPDRKEAGMLSWIAD